MLTTTILSPGVYWTILHWLQTCLRAREGCSRRLIESKLCHDTSWLPCSCKFLGSGGGPARHPKKWFGALVRTGAQSWDRRQPYCDTSTPQPRPFITTPFRRHGLSYPGANTTVKLVSQRFVWFVLPGVGKDCHAWTRTCTPLSTTQGKAARKCPSGVSTSCQHVSLVHIDLVGPLPVSSGYQYCLTAIDRYTRWPEALPLSDITTKAVAKAFVCVWVAHFGRPQQITTDQGRQFEACFFKTLATITRSSLTGTTAWHSTSNGMIKRLRCQLKAALMCQLMNIGPKLYRWSCWGFAVHGRRTWKPHQTSVRFSPVVTMGILHPFPHWMHWHHWLCVPAEGPHWKASAHTSIPACRAIHFHFQGPGHSLAYIFMAWCLLGSPPCPVCRTILGPLQGQWNLFHWGSGCCEESLHWLPEAGVCPPC